MSARPDHFRSMRRWLLVLFAANAVVAATYALRSAAYLAQGGHPVLCAYYALLAACMLALDAYLVVDLRRLRGPTPPRTEALPAETYRETYRDASPPRPGRGARRTG